MKMGSLLLAGIVALATIAVATAANSDAPRQVLVPKTTIYPGQTVQAGALMWRRWRGRPDALQGYAVEMDDVVGQVARRTLVAGRLIATGDVRVPHAVAQGQIVPIVFRSGGIVILGRGVALQAGAAGTIIQVRNLDSSRVITGKIEGNGSVRVGAEP